MKINQIIFQSFVGIIFGIIGFVIPLDSVLNKIIFTLSMGICGGSIGSLPIVIWILYFDN